METALLYITDSLRNICAIRSAAVWCLDISAAFNTIDHPNMPHILEDYFYIYGIPLFGLHSYFSKRKKIVKKAAFRFGVSQGSVLGLILFFP